MVINRRDMIPLKSFFAERFFMLFDEDGGGTIDLSEMMAGLVKLTRGTAKDKLKFLFDVYDVDGTRTFSLLQPRC